MALAGCNAAGEPGGDKTFSDEDVPFTFSIPAEFTKADVDTGNSAGDVIAGAGITKVDVIAVRRLPSGGVAEIGSGGQRHEVLGHEVTSELHPVEQASGYAIECQYTEEYREDVLDACRTALDSVRRK